MLERGQQNVSTQLRGSATPKQCFAARQSALWSSRFPAFLVISSRLAWILLLCLRPGFTQQVEDNTDASEVVRGTVVNKLSHDPIGRALVYSPDNRFATLTDGEGHFEFRLPKQDSAKGSSGTYFFPRRGFVGNGPYQLSARKPGFLDDPVSRGVPLSPGIDTPIFLIPEAIIEGRLLLPSAESSPRITLQLFKRQISQGRPRWIGTGTAQTNSGGEFRFAELGPGEYKIMTLEQLDNEPGGVILAGPTYGFPPSCFPGVPDFYSGAPIQLTMGEIFDASMALARQPYFPVRIPVAGVDPGSGMSVSVFAQGHAGPGYRLGFNPNQHRIEGLLPSGAYLIQGTTFEPHAAVGVASITVAGRELDGPILALAVTSPVPIHVREEFTATNQNLSTTWNDGKRNFRIRGPRAYLNVYLEPVGDFAPGGGGGLRPPQSPDDETLEITNVWPGRYWVHINSSRGYPASITSGDVDLRQDPLVVSLGGNPPIEITMRDDGATIEGTVSARNPLVPGTNGSTGEQIEVARRAWIYCLPVPGSTGRFRELGGATFNGKFSLPMMVPGAYRVLAFDHPQPEIAYHDPEAMRLYDALGQVVNLGAGQTLRLEVEPITTVE